MPRMRDQTRLSVSSRRKNLPGNQPLTDERLQVCSRFPFFRDTKLHFDPMIRPAQPKHMALGQGLSFPLESSDSFFESRLAVTGRRPVRHAHMLVIVESCTIKKLVQVLRSICSAKEPVQASVCLDRQTDPWRVEFS